MTTKKTTPRLGSAKDNAELQNFAHHLAEALRIALQSDDPRFAVQRLGKCLKRFRERSAEPHALVRVGAAHPLDP